MHTGRAVLLLLAIGVLAAFTTSTLDDHTRAASAGGSDCRTISGSPTASTTPTPTPPWIPYFSINICNDTASAASDLHLVLRHPAANFDPGSGAPGCPYPGYAHSGGDPPEYTIVDINYGTPCVDPGESVYIFLHAGCSTPQPRCEPPVVTCYYWTLDGQPVPSESPAGINPSRCQNPQPVPTPEPRTPTPRNGTDTPPPSPFFTPTPTPDPVTIATILNDTGKFARGLILHSHGTEGVMVFQNAPGCDNPSVYWADESLDPLIFTWRLPCIDPGESVSIRLSSACTGCAAPEVYGHEWTFNTPTPSGQTKSPSPTPTLTPFVTATSHSSATPAVTPAALPRTGAAQGSSRIMIAWLIAGVALAATGFTVARRSAAR